MRRVPGGAGLHKIVSGGQTGVDRAALDAAIETGIPHGGWVPTGRIAEDGRIADRYSVTETGSTEYPVRTEMNIRDSDGTLIVTRGSFDGGTALTARLAEKLGRPLFIVEGAWSLDTIERVRQWIEEKQIDVLNVAGPRESKSPGIYGFALGFLVRLFTGKAGIE